MSRLLYAQARIWNLLLRNCGPRGEQEKTFLPNEKQARTEQRKLKEMRKEK